MKILTATVFALFLTTTAHASYDNGPSAVERYAQEQSAHNTVTLTSQPEIGSTTTQDYLSSKSFNNFWKENGAVTIRYSNPNDQ